MIKAFFKCVLSLVAPLYFTLSLSLCFGHCLAYGQVIPSKQVRAEDTSLSKKREKKAPNSTSQKGTDSQKVRQREAQVIGPKKFIESEQIVDKETLWEQDGLRVDLAYHQTTVSGLNQSPNGIISGVHIGIATYLDSQWSLDSSFRYGVGSEGLSGLNFSGLLSTLFHWHGLGLGLGIGVVGVEERSSNRPNLHEQLSNQVVASFTQADTTPVLSKCVGFGPLAALNAVYRLPITSVFGLKAGTQIDIARIACALDTERVEPDTARPIVIKQYWDRWSWSFFGGLTWR